MNTKKPKNDMEDQRLLKYHSTLNLFWVLRGENYIHLCCYMNFMCEFQKVEEKTPFFGPQYTVVGMESGSSDAAGKIQILKSKVALEDLGSSAEVQRIVDKKNELEK